MTAGDRKRRFRERRQRGEGVAPVPFDWPMVEVLVDHGYLAWDDSQNRNRIGEAIAAAMNDPEFRKVSGTRS